MAVYLRPSGLEQALDALHTGPFAILAGGTDFYPAHVGRRVEDAVLDISAIAALRGISRAGGFVRIGATTTWSDLIEAELPAWARGLKLVAREVGGVQIQNAGTVAGNLCNASPAADGVPMLLALDARVELASTTGRRTLPLGDFITGSRHTTRRAEELVTAVLIPDHVEHMRTDFQKLGARRYLVISIVMVGAAIEADEDGVVTRCGIAVGACSPVARRLPTLEHRLIGERLDARLAEHVDATCLAPIAPIDDVRGTAGYRREAAVELVRRAIEHCAHE